MSESVDAIVVGAGVVGLAVARSLAMRGLETIVLERHSHAGEETSSRNSGVIHSGIYYPTGSNKARFCVRGRELLYEYCRARNVPHSQCGKLLVAQASQTGKLRALIETGRSNGVHDLQWLERKEIAALEPAVRCDAAVLSPSTGIVDVHEYMGCLEADLEALGGTVVFGTSFVSATIDGAGFQVAATSSGEEVSIGCRQLVNAGGLSALQLLDRIAGYPEGRRRQSFFAKGHYFSCRGSSPFKHLVYPMPSEAGLGVHATLDLAGKLRFGPDVEWVQGLNYEVDSARAESFYQAIREYWPDLPDGALQPDYSGIRPKLVGPGAAAADFEIEGPQDHGIPGLINLLGIESPGLTSSLAIAEHVVSL